jgi:cytochrome P450
MLPPGPRGALWTTFRYLKNPEGTLFAMGKKYGDVFTVPTLVRPLVVAASPETVRSIFAADPDTFSPFAGEMGVPLLGRGSVLLQAGAKHRRARKLMQPPFHGARMRTYAQRMGEIAAQRLAAAPKGQFDCEELFRGISLQVILSTVFGVEEPTLGERVLEFIKAFSPLVASFAFLRGRWFPHWRRFLRLQSDVQGMLRTLIDERKRAPGTDIASLLVAARDEEGQPLDDQEIVEQLVTLVIAGHETTATALAWAVDEVFRQPALVERLRDSLDGNPEQLASNKLLDAVCAETLRIHPLVPIVGRNLERPFELAGYTIPAGVGVGACPTLAHRREDLYPDAGTFKPERFLDGRNFSPHEYLPFGGGARRCVGAAFAFYEMKIVFGTLLLQGDLRLVSPVRAATGVRPATVGPRGGVKVRYTPRETASPVVSYTGDGHRPTDARAVG